LLCFCAQRIYRGRERHKILKGLDREVARTEILKELDGEATRTARKAVRWGGILVLKFQSVPDALSHIFHGAVSARRAAKRERCVA